MKAVKLIGMGVALALVSTAAYAFQEQGASGAPAAPPAAQVVPDASKGMQVAPDAVAQPSTSGTEVRIPGLGRLGVLPKMDFGLELLYGASERKQELDNPNQSGEDLQIRGSLKHRF